MFDVVPVPPGGDGVQAVAGSIGGLDPKGLRPGNDDVTVMDTRKVSADRICQEHSQRLLIRHHNQLHLERMVCQAIEDAVSRKKAATVDRQNASTASSNEAKSSERPGCSQRLT